MKTKTKREPDFNNLIKILRREKPNRPTAFEFGIGGHVLSYYLGGDEPISDDVNSHHAYIAKGFFAAGYDYAPIRPFDSPIYDPISVERSKTISLNGRAAII
ncbi:MAG: hypothetical protein FWH01_11300, partial [Oscillospiraceae bacterium]|nr:hypothetical protein [Oscillospiraceae bacterium]